MYNSIFTGRNYAQEILDNGGATFYVQKTENGVLINNSTMTDGYFVGTVGHEMLIPVESFTTADLAFFISENYWELVLSQKFLGAWVEGDYVYLDVSDHWADEHSAMGAGRARRQVSIFDVAAGEAIFL